MPCLLFDLMILCDLPLGRLGGRYLSKLDSIAIRLKLIILGPTVCFVSLDAPVLMATNKPELEV